MIKVYLIDSENSFGFDAQEATTDEFKDEAKRQADALGKQTEFDLTEFQEYFNKGGTNSSKEYVRFVIMH